MRRLTTMKAQYRAETAEGETLHFEECRCNSYFSTEDEFGLKIAGKMSLGGEPAPTAPVEIRCVKAGTKIRCCGKNLFDVTNAEIKKWYITNGKISNGTNGRMIYIQCQPNTTYTMSKIAGKYFYLGYTTEEPDDGVGINGTIVNNTANNITITTGSDAVYLVSWFYHAAQDGITLDEMAASIQIEYGGTPTPYEPYTGNEITVPCDLYNGDIWYPASGKVEKYNRVLEFDGTEYWDKDWNTYSNKIVVYRKIQNGDAAPYLDVNIGYGYSTHIATHSYPTTVNATYANAIAVTASTQQLRLSLTDTVVGELTKDGVKAWLAQQAANGTPFTVLYKTKKYVEQYEPTPIYAPSNTINVVQSPVGLTAGMEATMLVRR